MRLHRLYAFTARVIHSFRRGGEDHFGDNFASLVNDIEDRLFAVLPDDTWFYPGHGDDSTLGKDRPSVAQWRARGW